MSNLVSLWPARIQVTLTQFFAGQLVYLSGQSSATFSWNSKQYRVSYADSLGGSINLLLGNYPAATGAVTRIIVLVDLARRFCRLQVKELP